MSGDSVIIEETIAALGTHADEIIVRGARAICDNAGPYEHALAHRTNTCNTYLLLGD